MVKKNKEKENTKETDSSSLFDKQLKILSKEYGNKALVSLEQLRQRPIVGISTGSLGLDYALNPEIGGLVKGRIIEIWGPPSSGKTTLTMCICANVTANKEQVIFIDAEQSLDPQLVVNAGVDQDYFHILDEGNARNEANIIDTLMKTGEVGLVVIDSVPAWTPPPEAKKGDDDVDITKQRMANQAGFISTILPPLCRTARMNGTTIILLNQARSSFSAYGPDIKAYGGLAAEHFESVRIRITGRANMTTKQIHDDKGKIIGQKVTALVEKNKTSVPMQDAELPIYLGKGVNPYHEVATLAQKFELVDGASGRFRMPGDDKQLAHGFMNFVALLESDEDLYASLRKQVIDTMGIKYASDRKVVTAYHNEKLERHK